ncbi:MAG: sialidase family protein, partial [Salinivirgaceae bacterium]|nr:sialidase family protein [Salinivirgaceae bacterium]
MIRNTQKTLLAILFWTMATLATGQQWSEPVQISDMEGLDNYPEFCIDNNGVIHVVWTHAASSFYDHSVVYYSKSTNDGATWSEPLNISQNEEKAIARPKIVADSENRLYVAYNYNFLEVYDQKILMQRFDGQNWTTAADTVSGNQTPCWAPRLAVGTDDKVYCFFLNGGQAYTTLYRTFQNGQWGEIIEPYPEAYSISIVPIVDNSNTIHAKGSYSNSNMEHQPIYTIFENGEWANPFIKVFKRTEGYTQMAVDQNNKPHFCWAQCSPEASNNIDTLTHFYLENDQWKSEVLEITESQIETSDLLVDQNNTLN